MPIFTRLGVGASSLVNRRRRSPLLPIAVAAAFMASGVVLPSLSVGAEEPYVSNSLLGSYLAGRIAEGQRDAAAAADFYRQALTRDPGNEAILNQAFLAELQLGLWPAAIAHARQAIKSPSGNRLAFALLGLESALGGSYAAAEKNFKDASSGAIGELTSTLARAWVKTASGKPDDALRLLDSLQSADWARYYRLYHRANIAAFAGKADVAEAAFAELFSAEPRTLNVAVAYARFLSSQGQKDRAREVIVKHIGDDGDAHPDALALLARLAAGEKMALMVDTIPKGLAEVFHGIGEAIANDRDGNLSIGTAYLQLSLRARPDYVLALASLAGVQEASRRFDLAIDTYSRIPNDVPISFGVALRKAVNLNSLDRVDEAKSTLLDAIARSKSPSDPAVARALLTAEIESLPKIDANSRGEAVRKLQGYLQRVGYPIGTIDGIVGKTTLDSLKKLQHDAGLPETGIFAVQTRKALADKFAALVGNTDKQASERLQQAYTTLGNITRGREKFDEAANAYGEAIKLVPKIDKEHWNLFYSRAVCFERLKQWPKAEADFLKSIELDGEQAISLNYLGYSWVDQGINLDKGLDLIKKAVRLRPDDGYFIDSLGWAYFQLGRFEEAAAELERAVELKASDPVINDHLGDAYWRVGRRDEAKFQWSAALSSKPEEADKLKIEEKLTKGLPEVPASKTADGSAGDGNGAKDAGGQPVNQ